MPRRPGEPGPSLEVVSDLTFSVDLGRGPIEGRVEAAGSQIRVHTDDADTVWEAATSVPEVGTAGLPWLADRLTDAGLTLEVVGPQGRVATVGAGTSSRIGRLVTGSSAIAPGDRAAVVGLVRARIRRNGRPIALAVVALAVVAVGVAVAAGWSRAAATAKPSRRGVRSLLG